MPVAVGTGSIAVAEAYGQKARGSGTTAASDEVAIASIVTSERWARDMAQWDIMQAAYHPGATVDISCLPAHAAARSGIVIDLLMCRDHSSYGGSCCQVLCKFRIDTHTTVVAGGTPANSRARVAGRFIITPITTPAVSGRTVEQICLELAAAGSRGRQLRPRPTPIRASLSGLITI
jgi:hypothetical protein